MNAKDCIITESPPNEHIAVAIGNEKKFIPFLASAFNLASSSLISSSFLLIESFIEKILRGLLLKVLLLVCNTFVCVEDCVLFEELVVTD